MTFFNANSTLSGSFTLMIYKHTIYMCVSVCIVGGGRVQTRISREIKCVHTIGSLSHLFATLNNVNCLWWVHKLFWWRMCNSALTLFQSLNWMRSFSAYGELYAIKRLLLVETHCSNIETLVFAVMQFSNRFSQSLSLSLHLPLSLPERKTNRKSAKKTKTLT